MDMSFNPAGVKPRRGGVVQTLRKSLYDTLLLENQASATLQPTMVAFRNNSNLGDYRLSNMEQVGKLANDKEFEVFGLGIECAFANAALYQQFIATTRVELRLGSDVVKLRTFVSQCPSGGGAYGFDSAGAALSNGLPQIGNYYRFDVKDPIVISQNKTFNVSLIFDDIIAGAPSTVRAAINNDAGFKCIRVWLHGVETGDITDN